jgi:hypothetical protein
VSIAAFAGFPAAAYAARPLPDTAMRLCVAGHFSCQGHWTRLGGRTVYELSTRFALKGDGQIIPLVTGCTPSSASYCTVSNVGGGRCWSDNSQPGNMVKVVLNDCDPDSLGQAWTSYLGCGGGCLTWMVDLDGRCLNDPAGSLANGTQMQMWDCYTTINEDFAWQRVGPNGSQLLLGAENFEPLPGNPGCLSDDGDSSPGAPLVIETCNGGSNQRWYWPPAVHIA